MQPVNAEEFWRALAPMAIIGWPCLGTFAMGALASLLLLSGLDDLVPLSIVALACVRRRGRAHQVAESTGERRIAIFVPCWRESAVIGNMVRHNLSTIRYRNFDFFLGVYPNDEDTVKAAEQLADQLSNVHVAYCPHPGPTSKADCLNCAYQQMLRFEEEHGVSFDTVVLHDAEDLIHPQALELINRERAIYEMVQVPVLPLKTGFADVTHGVYCDEFAEFQTIDMRARQLSRSFMPSNGVGTGFAKEVLERLAHERNCQPFDPASLTEDYEIGVQIHRMGYRQTFSRLVRTSQDFVATREYFPRSTRAAIRQRTRWITGIALQCWERQGWKGSWRTRYWFWRDRKGLLTNPLSVIANVLFFAGLIDYVVGAVLHRPWLFEIQNPIVATLCEATTILQCFRLAIRGVCVGRIFGIAAAFSVPLRSFHANLINCMAAIRAVHQYFKARREKRTVAWQKTEHAYPNRESLHAHRRELQDVLVGCGFISKEVIANAQHGMEDGAALDLLLLQKGLISEEDMCKAMCLQSGLPDARVNLEKVNSRVLRGLPAHIERQYRVLPFDVKSGRLLLASPSVPDARVYEEISRLTNLPLEIQIVTPSTYAELRQLLDLSISC